MSEIEHSARHGCVVGVGAVTAGASSDNGEPWGDDWLWWAAGTVVQGSETLVRPTAHLDDNTYGSKEHGSIRKS